MLTSPPLFSCLLTALSVLLAAGPIRAELSFNKDIRPILSNKCFACHGPDEETLEGDLRLDTREGALADLGGGFAAIVPGNLKESELIYRVETDDEDDLMPPPKSGERLTPEEVAILKQWINEGAEYEKHWSYQKPERPPLPEVKQDKWVRNAIDQFLLACLEQEKLNPAGEADRYALGRRVALDLTGLPLTAEEAEAFAKDERPDAYERLVDDLLSRSAFGEHWARMWLDLARYADSAGYADDPARTIWAYRDYVIKAFNENMPFDQFTIEQIAGDLLENPTEDQLIATAFHRNTQTNNEGGTNDEEYRNVAVVDRVNTTGQVWMGTTMACVQCHTHKYDPITQKEYFQMFAILNQSEDADRRNEAPVHSLFTEEQLEQRRKLTEELATLTEKEKAAGEDVGDEEKKKLAEAVVAKKKELDGVKPRTTVPIMRELPEGKRRKTHVQLRGNFLDKADEVGPGVPAAFHPLPEGYEADRLGLAHWLVDEENPLTGRVVANRFWEKIFGIGIVATSEEFGSQGEQPFHPELLDWLAVEFVESGWDMKKLLRLMVTSAAYRQESRVTPELVERDPENRLLARGPRFRLTAERLRDQSLFVAGLLSDKMYGPPVNPPQPNLGVKAAFGGGIDWKTSPGEDKFRRGIYTRWRRSNPYPSMASFDAPNREVCTVRRDRTNTPLQAFVTLNDPVYVEAAQALARRMNERGGVTGEKINRGIRLALGRPPQEKETQRLTSLYETVKAVYDSDPEEARKMATVPLGDAPSGSDVPELAALTVVANVLLNLDEMLMKR